MVTSPSLPRSGGGWRLEELASAGRENLDESHVGRYDGKDDADAPSEVALLRDLGLDAHARLVEFGSGTGQLTVEAASACAELVPMFEEDLTVRPVQPLDGRESRSEAQMATCFSTSAE